MHIFYSSRNLILLLLLFAMQPSNAQNNCGCKEGEQLRAPIGMHFNSGRLDSAEFYIKKFLSFKESGCKINFNGAMAQVALAKKDFGSARIYLETENDLLQKNGCTQDLYVRHYSTLAKLYQELNMFDSMAVACFKGIEASQNAGDYYALSRANSDLAGSFAQMGENKKAFYYYQQSIGAAQKQTKVPTQVALIQIRLCNLYLSEFEKTPLAVYADSAALLAKQALDTASKYHELLTYLEANDALANHAILTGAFRNAIPYADVMINNSPRGVHLFDRLTYEGFSKKSEALFQLKDYTHAGQFADSALLYAQAFNAQMMAGAYKKIYQAAKANNNNSKSLAAYEKMQVINDSLFSVQKNTAISELEKKYNQAKNEKTIRELDQQKRIYLLLALAGLLGLGLLAFFIRQQSLKNKQKIMETEQRLNRSRMNPHFFFNALASLQADALEENDGRALAKSLSKFSHIMRETLESTYKEFVTIEQEIVFLQEYLELQQARFPGKFSFEILTGQEIEADDLQIPSMIVQPFAENSIEHGFTGINQTGHIQISFEKEAGELIIKIIDNGKGLLTDAKENTEHISRASQIIKDRLYLLNQKLKTKASFSISSNKNTQGVSVIITLPLLYKQDVKN